MPDNIMADLNYFVLTLASMGEDVTRYLYSNERLDGLKDAIPDIIATLGGTEDNIKARLAADSNKLILIDFLIYAGAGENSEIALGELPPNNVPAPRGRYSRALYALFACGIDIFNTDVERTPAQMQKDQARVNHFLDEIFRSFVDVVREDGTQERIRYKDIPDYGDFTNRPPFPNAPFDGGWTSFRVPANYDFRKNVGPGHGC